MLVFDGMGEGVGWVMVEGVKVREIMDAVCIIRTYFA